MKFVPRKISALCQNLSSQFGVILVTGARQAGKSTMLRKVFSEHGYYSLDDLRIRNQANESSASFFDFYNPPLILDEVQYAPDLLPYIKIDIDIKKFDQVDFAGNFILTGSQKFALIDQIQESLAGRMAILNLNTLSIEELLDEGCTLPNWTDLVYRSLYPEPFLNHNLDLKVWFDSYVQSWLNRDIRLNLKNSHLQVFDKFLSLIATRISTEENHSSIASELGVSRLTIQSWASLLEKTQVLYSLAPYHNNLGKRVIKSPKLYFLDTGLANYLSGFFNPQQLSNNIMTGAFFENFIITEVIKFFENRGVQAPLFFFRDNNGLEVDLIIELADKKVLIEIKSTDSPKSTHCKSLNKIASLFDNSILVEKVLVCNSKNEFPVDDVKVLAWQNLPSFLQELVD